MSSVEVTEQILHVVCLKSKLSPTHSKCIVTTTKGTVAPWIYCIYTVPIFRAPGSMQPRAPGLASFSSILPLPGKSGSFFHLIFLRNCHQWHCSRVSCREVKESSKHTDAAREAQDMRRSVRMCVHIESTSLEAEAVSSMAMLLLSSVCCCLPWACFITICSERIRFTTNTQLSLKMSLIPNSGCVLQMG